MSRTHQPRTSSAFLLPATAAVFLFASGCSALADEAPAAEPQTLDELRQAIADVLAENQSPGVGVALVSKDQVIWVAGIGQADRTTGRAVTADTLFRAGSISKSFVALAILKLQEEGRLHLDDRLRDLVGDGHFDNAWEETDPLLLAHALEHTAGFDDLSIAEIGGNFPNLALDTALSVPSRSRTCRWKPGRFFSYSNIGPPLAAYAVEKITRKSFERYVEEELFAPLRMKTASFVLTDSVEKDLATGYQRDGATAVPYCHIPVRPSGSLNITPAELAHLVQLLLNRGTYEGLQLLTPESVRRMETVTTTCAAQKGVRAGYGLGNFTTFHKGVRFQGHDGAIAGFQAKYAYAPERGVGYVVMINTTKGAVFSRIVGLVVDHLTHAWGQATLPVAAVADKRLQAFAGYYQPCTTRLELGHFLTRLFDIRRISVDGDALEARGFAGPTTRLVAINEDGVFRRASDPLATTAFVEVDGDLILSGSGNYRRVPGWFVWGQAAVAAVCLALMLSAALFALVWVPRKLFGRMRNVNHLSVRLLPLAAVLCLMAAFAAPFAGYASMDNIAARLGNLTPWSLSFCVLTWLFALSTIAGLLQAARRWGQVGRWVRTHSLLVSLANSVVLAYLAYWGIIGLRTWT